MTLYEALRDASGVYGTRFSGGGFGGSCIALIEPEAGPSIIEEVKRRYGVAHPEAAAEASFHICRPGGPAQVMNWRPDAGRDPWPRGWEPGCGR